MKEQVSINVHISEKTFPLKVSSEEEEIRVRSAAKKVNELLKEYSLRFSLKDKEMLLSMCALKFATELEEKKHLNGSEQELLNESIDNIDKMISKVLE
jgi:cell division protein ZapA (FtsZ GTPase activity inhibitor)